MSESSTARALAAGLRIYASAHLASVLNNHIQTTTSHLLNTITLYNSTSVMLPATLDTARHDLHSSSAQSFDSLTRIDLEARMIAEVWRSASASASRTRMEIARGNRQRAVQEANAVYGRALEVEFQERVVEEYIDEMIEIARKILPGFANLVGEDGQIDVEAVERWTLGRYLPGT